MPRLHNKNLVSNAKSLRKNQTKEERKLWYEFLHTLPVRFVRQKVLGNYIVDFYCAGANIVIELDGSQHYEEAGEAQDAIRDSNLNSLGLTVLRYSNLQIHKNFKSVCDDILKHLGLE